MSISDSTINRDVFLAIRTAIVGASPKITDPVSATTKTASVLVSYNDEESAVPQIVIDPASIDEADWKFGSFQGKKIINISVSCYFTKAWGMEQLADIVSEAVKTTAFDGMELIGVTTDYAFVNPNLAKYHSKTITFIFERE